MWNFAPNCSAAHTRSKSEPKSTQPAAECSDDDGSSITSRDEGLECPICWEFFNIVENVPYVLWCGHTLCKNCIIALQWAVVKFPTLPIQLPLFISCPWCNLLSFRLVYKGNLKFPRKNYFLLWMVENINNERQKCCSSSQENHVWSSSSNFGRRGQITNITSDVSSRSRRWVSDLSAERVNAAIRQSLVFFAHLTAKFPLVIIFLLIVVYAIPASAAILAVYMVITVVFAVPSFLILYFSYPSLDWLVREIIT